MPVKRKRLVVIALVVLAVAINALYDGKIAEFIGNKLHTWQTGETAEDRLARDRYRASVETRYQGLEACAALEDFARDVAAEAVARRGMRAEVILDNVGGNADRELVSAYLEAFENLAYKESREFDDALRGIVREYCEEGERTIQTIGP